MERTVTLSLTADCNLHCLYCYETHNANKRMSFNTAKHILDSEFADLQDSDNITIDFFGGEPFLEFDLMKRVIEYVQRQEQDGKFCANFRFFATTNGTLIHSEIQDYLKDHPNFYLGLSLDGTRWMHNTNRCNSFDKIDLDFFLKMFPDQPIKMTISSLTLPKLAEGILFAQEKGFRVACNLAYGLDWRDPYYKKILIEQLTILGEFYLEHPELERATILSRQIARLGYLKETDYQFAGKYCGTGTAMRTYNSDGRRYPCQFFMPISCGEAKAQKCWDIDFTDKIPIEKLEKKCRECVVIECCPTCYGSNYVATGNIYWKDPSLCELEKVIFYANAWFTLKMWDKGQLKNLPEDELLATLFASRRIIENFGSVVNT